MPKLIINRTSEWTNKMRDISIFLDETKIGTIGNAETKEFEISPGEHQLKAKIDWCGSKSITLNTSELEIQQIELSSFKNSKWLAPIYGIAIILYFTFVPISELYSTYFLVLIIPVLIYQFYYFTFGRNKYLRLKKQS